MKLITPPLSGLGDTWLIGGRTDTRDINDDLSSEPSRRVSRLSFKQIFHLKFSIVAPRSWGSETRGLLGLGALWQPGIFKVLSPLPLQAQCDSRATGRLGSQDRWHWWSLRAQPSEAAMIRGLVLAEANRDRVRDGGEWGKLFMTGALRHGTGFMLSIVHSSVATWGSWCSQHSLLA